MAATFRIPRVSDQELVNALRNVKASLQDLHVFRLQIVMPGSGTSTVVPDDDSTIDANSELALLLSLKSSVSARISLVSAEGQEACTVDRPFAEASDRATIHDNWHNQMPQDKKPLWPRIGSVLT